MKILVDSGELNKCDIFQLEVHDEEGYLLYYQLVPGRLVGSKKSPWLYLMLYQPKLDFLPEGLNEFAFPEEMD